MAVSLDLCAEDAAGDDPERKEVRPPRLIRRQQIAFDQLRRQVWIEGRDRYAGARVQEGGAGAESQDHRTIVRRWVGHEDVGGFEIEVRRTDQGQILDAGKTILLRSC